MSKKTKKILFKKGHRVQIAPAAEPGQNLGKLATIEEILPGGKSEPEYQLRIDRSNVHAQYKQSWLLRRCWHGHFNFWTKLANCPWSFKQNYYVETALMLADGSISEAAKLLGLNRTTLYSRMEALHKHKTKLTDSRVHNN